MASPLYNVEDMQKEIARLTQTVETLKKDAPMSMRRSTESTESPCGWVHNPPPVLRPYDSLSGRENVRPTKRKEIEARRYNGKESVVDYLRQFELTSNRNNWDDSDKASALLCALDGSARSILSEIDQDDENNYHLIKELLLKRFGPAHHTEVHEQALRDLKLTRGQPIRELATEVTRLAKLAYPDFEKPARCRLATDALINAVCDKDAIFYIKDKNPTSIDEACALYERYRVLTGGSAQRKAVAINGVKPEDGTQQNAVSTRDNELLGSLLKQTEAQGQQVQKLTDAVSLLLHTQATCMQPSADPAIAPTKATMAPPKFPKQNAQSQSRPPPGPCPRCKEEGHWRSECPRRNLGNGIGPSPAPGPRSPPYRQNQ